jgi:hypothetical protein
VLAQGFRWLVSRLNPGGLDEPTYRFTATLFDNNVFGNTPEQRNLQLRDRTVHVLQRQRKLIPWACRRAYDAIKFVPAAESNDEDNEHDESEAGAEHRAADDREDDAMGDE